MDIAQASHASFETLMHARKKDVDPFKDVDPKKLLAFSLQRLSQAHPGKVPLHTTPHAPQLCVVVRRWASLKLTFVVVVVVVVVFF